MAPVPVFEDHTFQLNNNFLALPELEFDPPATIPSLATVFSVECHCETKFRPGYMSTIYSNQMMI
ncbi:unnamed protein product [Penicillium roqueforti FM164]|uniref:Genomic scaffold, ProqFM164S03 n=1 Tax=Penicillium roqueforti (strain FM164) TaxID=1365484 RepID=W6QBW2_PENRF|nr:unnamed protein product [Penicillium roqueforti FM164]